MPDKSDLQVIFNALLIVLESHQRQIDELREQASAISIAATKLNPAFAEEEQNAADLLSNALQYAIAEKADVTAELRALILRLSA